MTEEQPTSPLPGQAGAPPKSARHPEQVGPYGVLKVLGEGTIGALADLERARDRPVAAESLYRRAIAEWEASGRDAQGSISMVSAGYAELLRQRGRSAEAAAIEAKSP